MIKFNIVCVGRLKEKYWVEAFSEYQKRISRYAETTVTECPEGQYEGSAAQLTKFEEDAILKKLKGFVILLDIGGQNLSSEDFAELIAGKSAGGASEFTFVIGGSRGVSERVRERADFRLSFGKATYPHRLARIILAEQLYRAVSINNNLSYHK